jgi:hypothetical protein
MKKTSVEWAIQEIMDNWRDYEYGDEDFDKLIELAKEMHRAEIIKAVNDTIKNIRVDKERKGFFVIDGKGYYDMTYKKDAE